MHSQIQLKFALSHLVYDTVDSNMMLEASFVQHAMENAAQARQVALTSESCIQFLAKFLQDHIVTSFLPCDANMSMST